jgi:signal peptidase I
MGCSRSLSRPGSCRQRGRGRDSVPHPFRLDGTVAALRQTGERLRGTIRRPDHRLPHLLPARRPARDQIVVFHAPDRAATDCGEGGIYVKRLIGLPGDAVHEDDRSRIWVDGRKLAEPYVTPSARAADIRYRNTTWKVPAGRYFLLGDNRGDSCDSRTWGTVGRRRLVGPVIAT